LDSLVERLQLNAAIEYTLWMRVVQCFPSATSYSEYAPNYPAYSEEIILPSRQWPGTLRQDSIVYKYTRPKSGQVNFIPLQNKFLTTSLKVTVRYTVRRYDGILWSTHHFLTRTVHLHVSCWRLRYGTSADIIKFNAWIGSRHVTCHRPEIVPTRQLTARSREVPTRKISVPCKSAVPAKYIQHLSRFCYYE